MCENKTFTNNFFASQVLQALESAEKKGPPALATMFDDVYKEKTPELERQEAKLLEHLAKYPERYTGPGH